MWRGRRRRGVGAGGSERGFQHVVRSGWRMEECGVLVRLRMEFSEMALMMVQDTC
jgi:hypothetical protein